MRKVFILLFLIAGLFANYINDLLIIEAKLYPKIVMLDKNIDGQSLKIAVIYDEKNFLTAKKFQEYLKINKLNSFLLNENNKIKKADAYVLAIKNPSQKLINKLLKEHKLIFGVYPESIKNTMIGIYIGTKVKPIINPILIKKGKVCLNPIILKVSKIYEE